MKTISDTAIRRMVRQLNKHAGWGGRLVFDYEGRGGAWYSSRAYGFGDGMIAIPVPSGRTTIREVRDHVEFWLYNHPYSDE